MLALITEWGLGLGAAGCVAMAVAAYAYLPFMGRYVAAALIAVAAGLAAYDMGFAARGRLDQSQAIQAQLDAAREQIQGAQIVGEAAASRAQDAEQQAATLQEQIREYETALAAKPYPVAVPGCLRVAPACTLDADDVRALDRLRDGSRAGRATEPASRAR